MQTMSWSERPKQKSSAALSDRRSARLVIPSPSLPPFHPFMPLGASKFDHIWLAQRKRRDFVFNFHDLSTVARTGFSPSRVPFVTVIDRESLA